MPKPPWRRALPGLTSGGVRLEVAVTGKWKRSMARRVARALAWARSAVVQASSWRGSWWMGLASQSSSVVRSSSPRKRVSAPGSCASSRAARSGKASTLRRGLRSRTRASGTALWRTIAGAATASHQFRQVLTRGAPRRSVRQPVPRVSTNPLRFATSKARRSSSFSRCGVPREPVPFFFAGRPQLMRSTSSFVGRAFVTNGWRRLDDDDDGAGFDDDDDDDETKRPDAPTTTGRRRKEERGDM
mmetsp:Transcript_26610/g.81782  ORF Transcript_26610/g.81782 Transcript_26610/m.81782 type:complete len:244 (-) Transcript_26610:2383-3114(-)